LILVEDYLLDIPDSLTDLETARVALIYAIVATQSVPLVGRNVR